jgi:S-adenosylmethionine hydrolase
MAVPISFISDFGLADEFVGVVHGVVARIAPDVRVIDIGHDFPRGEIRVAAMALLRAIQYLPQGVALAVVDPGVGTERRAIAARTEWGTFIGPDNGLLAPAVAMVGGADLIVALENEDYRLPSHGATFHGRDIFAPAAAVLAGGDATVEDLGPPVPSESVTPLMLPLPEQEGGMVRGEILWVDTFGNAQTNLGPDDLGAIGVGPGDRVIVRVGAIDYELPWLTAYGAVGRNQGLVHVDSYGQIAIAVNGGRADEQFNLEYHMAVTLRSAADTGPAPGGATPLDLRGSNGP